MNLARLRAVLERELLEISKNRTMLVAIILPPLMLTVLPLVMVVALGSSLSGTNSTPQEIAGYIQAMPELAGMNADQVMEVIVLRQFLILYLIMPLVIPTTIATASIIGEKQMRSLEPLLATPIRTGELLLAKSFAAVLPALLATWLAYGLFYAGTGILVQSSRVFGALLNPMWFLAMLVLAPLLCLLSVSLGVIISSRVNDARVAQQLAGLVVIPIVVVAVGQTAGFVLLNTYIFALASLVVLLIDAAVLYAGVQLFEREAILTRWK